MLSWNQDCFLVTFSQQPSFVFITDWLAVMEKWKEKEILGTPCQERRSLNRENQHFWGASLVSLVTNLQASGSLGSSLLWVALAPWPAKKRTQRLILCATKGQMKPQLDHSWPGRIPTSFSGALGNCFRGKVNSSTWKARGVLFSRLWEYTFLFFFFFLNSLSFPAWMCNHLCILFHAESFAVEINQAIANYKVINTERSPGWCFAALTHRTDWFSNAQSAGILCYPLSALHLTFIWIWMRVSVCTPKILPFQGWYIPETTTPNWSKTFKTTWWRIAPSATASQCVREAQERLSHRWPACCCRTSPRSWRASSRTPTWTGSTGHPPWPTLGSARPRHPGTGRERRTPVPPTSGASTPTPGPPLCRSRMKPCLKYLTLSNKNKKKKCFPAEDSVVPHMQKTRLVSVQLSPPAPCPCCG